MDGSSWKLSFTQATSMEAIFMSVWMGASMKASMNFTRKPLPGFGCFHRICRSNFREFGGKGLDLLFAEASMVVAVPMDASVEVVVIVPHLHRHP